jgi:hypothetical protein
MRLAGRKPLDNHRASVDHLRESPDGRYGLEPDVSQGSERRPAITDTTEGCLMKHSLFRCIGLGATVAALGAAPAAAATTTAATTGAGATPVDTSSCTEPALTQPFRAWGDSNWYALAPGQTADDFTGAGWTLTGGAKIVTATLKDGTTGSVLDLHRGSEAVSPTICLTSDYPTARAMIRNVSGSNGGSVGFSVSYAGTGTATAPVQTGTFKTTGSAGVAGDWAPSDPANLDPSTTPDWQLMRITLTATGPKEFQVYNLYNDPMMRG